MVRKKKKATKTASKVENKSILNQDSSTSSDDDSSTVKSESNANDDERTLIIKSTKELGKDIKKPDKGLCMHAGILHFHLPLNENIPIIAGVKSIVTVQSDLIPQICVKFLSPAQGMLI